MRQGQGAGGERAFALARVRPVCRQVKQDPATSGIMILMVTALNELGDIERAVSAGCDDFLSKPINKLELLKRVENMLRLREVTDELERLRRYIDGVDDEAGPEATRPSASTKLK